MCPVLRLTHLSDAWVRWFFLRFVLWKKQAVRNWNSFIPVMAPYRLCFKSKQMSLAVLLRQLTPSISNHILSIWFLSNSLNTYAHRFPLFYIHSQLMFLQKTHTHTQSIHILQKKIKKNKMCSFEKNEMMYAGLTQNATW